MSKTRDAKLDALGRRVDQLKGEYETAKARTSARKADKDRAYAELAWHKSEIAELRDVITDDHRMASDCHTERDHYHEQLHSSNTHNMRLRLDNLCQGRNRARMEFDSFRDAFSSALEEQRAIKGRLDKARFAFQSRLAIVRDQRTAEAAKWHDRRCDRCGTTFRYHQDWTHIAKLCPTCREKEKTGWRERPCKQCGATVRYRVEWSRPPELCRSCQGREKAKWSERTCKGCGCPIRYNIEWSHPPNYCKECKAEFAVSNARRATRA